MIYGKQDIVKQDCTFFNNLANYGNDIATEPRKLELKIYKFDESLKYLYDNLSLQLIQSDKNTVLCIFNEPLISFSNSSITLEMSFNSIRLLSNLESCQTTSLN